MNSYYNKNNIYMNRAERRKNGIKSPKIVHYTDAELKAMIKKELSNLINESCSETIKRERYQRLEPLIERYQKQNKTEQKSQNKNVVDIYNEEKAKLPRNEVYRKLNANTNIKSQNTSYRNNRTYEQQRNIYGYKTQTTSNYTTKRAMSAYGIQMNYSNAMKKQTSVKNNVPIQTAKKTTTAQKSKTGLFSSIFSAKNKKVEKTPSISRPTVSTYTTRYNYSTNRQYNRNVNSRPSNKYRDTATRRYRELNNEFEKRIRYRGETTLPPSYKYIRNGREYKYEPRCL